VIIISNTNIRTMVLGILVLLLLGGGYFFYQSSQKQSSIPAQPLKPITVDTLVDQDQDIINQDEFPTRLDTNDLVTMIMEDSSTLVGKLSPVQDYIGSGTAYLLREKDQLYHYVQANLPDPNPGLVYEGWLVAQDPPLKFFSTGVMEKSSDGTYTLTYSSTQAYPEYNHVVITLETQVDAIPEAHVLEGTVE
jgi:hypothetical protein